MKRRSICADAFLSRLQAKAFLSRLQAKVSLSLSLSLSLSVCLSLSLSLSLSLTEPHWRSVAAAAAGLEEAGCMPSLQAYDAVVAAAVLAHPVRKPAA